MRKLFLSLYVFMFLVASNYALYAQPGDTNGDDDVEGGSDPETSINSKLILLAIAAISFAYYYFSKRRQENLTSN